VGQCKPPGGSTQAVRRKPPGVWFTRFNAILTSNELATISRGRIIGPLKIKAVSGASHPVSRAIPNAAQRKSPGRLRGTA